MMGPAVSVVIPVHNGEKTLRRCLDSVLKQSYANYEVVVIDNNSADDTGNIIKEYQKKHEKVVCISELKIGRGAARNAGIKKATGEIIVMADADCVVPENWIEGLIKPIVHENETAVMGFEKDLVGNYWSRNIQRANRKFFERNLDGKYISHIDTKNFAIKSSVMKKLMFDSSLVNFDDLDLYLRLKKIARVRFDSSIVVAHDHKSSFIGVIKINFDRGFWTAKIYKKHKSAGLANAPMFESLSTKNFLLFPFWIILQFIKRPLGEAFFLLVSETAWRAGILLAKLR